MRALHACARINVFFQLHLLAACLLASVVQKMFEHYVPDVVALVEGEHAIPAPNSRQRNIQLSMREWIALENYSQAQQRLALCLVHAQTISRNQRVLYPQQRERQSGRFWSYCEFRFEHQLDAALGLPGQHLHLEIPAAYVQQPQQGAVDNASRGIKIAYAHILGTYLQLQNRRGRSLHRQRRYVVRRIGIPVDTVDINVSSKSFHQVAGEFGEAHSVDDVAGF